MSAQNLQKRRLEQAPNLGIMHGPPEKSGYGIVGLVPGALHGLVHLGPDIPQLRRPGVVAEVVGDQVHGRVEEACDRPGVDEGVMHGDFTDPGDGAQGAV